MMVRSYHHIRHLLFIAPFWLLGGHVAAIKPPLGDDVLKSFSYKPKRQSDNKSDFSLSEDSGFSDFDDSDLSDIDLDEKSPFAKKFEEPKLGEDELELDLDGGDDENFQQNSLLGELTAGKETMYEAYNQLHTLAQEYQKPFDAPAVVVIGHQSSGKSALIEALMGFQFNQVGGGTKTRRPVALRMQYNPKCKIPKWFLVGDDGKERPMSLKEVQHYIEKENRRLAKDPKRSFDPREINIRMEYKHCPNMILIDTPGLISAPKISKGRSASESALGQQRALLASAREAERLVIDKMKCEDYIILCVEDTFDWKHGTTREVVQKADPDLSRTVIVNTKFDTKLPQFGTPSDVEEFLRAQILDRISPHKLGGPFFTSVPSGRVGRAHNALMDSGDYMYGSDEAFVGACKEGEVEDRKNVVQKMKRLKWTNEVTNAALTQKVGLGKLRKFLEQQVDEAYRKNVNKIIPMLQAEYVAAERRLQAVEKEIEALSVERLKSGADTFCDEFCDNLKKVIHGSVTAPAQIFGETLAQESSTAGSFHNVENCPMAVSDRTWERLVEAEVGNGNSRLYGGSQYHRSLREFNLAIKCLRTPVITEDEIANAAGVGSTHDGVNFLHAACVISLEKARTSFEPLLNTLVMRMTHIMGRLCPVTEYMLREARDRGKVSNFRSSGGQANDESFEETGAAMDISQHPQFRELIRSVFEKFVQNCADQVMEKCRDDLNSITRYVAWNLDQRGSGALVNALPDQTNLFAVYQVAMKKSNKPQESLEHNNKSKKKHSHNGALTPMENNNNQRLTPMGGGSLDRDYYNLIQVMEEAAMSRHHNRTNIVIGGLVQHIVSHWRDQFCRSVTTKFNCYFMLPFVDDLHRYLRKELQKIYAGEESSEECLNDVFDLKAARRALELRRDELTSECMANKQLQDKFKQCSRMMRKQDY